MGGGGDGENEKRMVFLLTLSIGCTFLPMAMFVVVVELSSPIKPGSCGVVCS